MKRRPNRSIPAFVPRFAQAFTFAVGFGVAHAAVPPKALPMTVKAATSMAQAVQDGAKFSRKTASAPIRSGCLRAPSVAI